MSATAVPTTIKAMIRRGWNDAVAGRSFNREASLDDLCLAYEYGRLLVAETRFLSENGCEPVCAWSDRDLDLPDHVYRAMVQMPNLPGMTFVQAVEHKLIRERYVAEQHHQQPVKKRRRAGIRRW